MPAFDGVWEVRVNYTATVGTQVIPHVLTFDVKLASSPDPGQGFPEIAVTNHDLSESLLSTLVTDLINKIKGQFAAATTFTTAELWKYPPTGYDATFYSAYALGVDGIAGGALNPAHYSILTFRTTGGGIMKLYLLETVSTSQGIVVYPTGNTAYDELFEFVTAADTAFVGRDDSNPLAPLKISSGQNEALWRRRYRS